MVSAWTGHGSLSSAPWKIIGSLRHRSTLETLFCFYEATRRNIPASHLHTFRRENLKSHILLLETYSEKGLSDIKTIKFNEILYAGFLADPRQQYSCYIQIEGSTSWWPPRQQYSCSIQIEGSTNWWPHIWPHGRQATAIVLSVAQGFCVRNTCAVFSVSYGSLVFILWSFSFIPKSRLIHDLSSCEIRRSCTLISLQGSLVYLWQGLSIYGVRAA
jgi:hypothetical protein